MAVDLFSGCGGLSVGLVSAGFRVKIAVDIDPLAIQAYRLNHRQTRLWRRDIFALEGSDILQALDIPRGTLDLLAGCPPCQGFSDLRTLRRARSVDDARNDLVSEFGRLVREVLPKAVLMENVPGLAHDPRFHKFVAQLRRHRYKVRWDVLDAADFGVAQRRKRLIVVAARAGKIELPEPQQTRHTVRDVLASLPKPGSSNDPAHDHLENRSPRIRALIAQIPRDGGSRDDLGMRAQLPCHRRLDGFHDIYGRMAWDKVAPTITSGFVNPSKGRFLHPTQNRTVTVREAALLQSFPPRYRLPMECGKFPVAQLIGNAVPPKFAEMQARCIYEFLDKTENERG